MVRAMRSFVVALSVLALSIGCACGDEPPPTRRYPSSAEHPPSADHAPSAEHAASPHSDSEDYAGGIAWHVDPPLVPHAPSSAMRAAEYVVTDHPDTTLAVFHFGAGQGGSLDDNLNRWIDQFTQPDGRSSREVAVIEHIEVGGLPVTTVDVSGSFSGMRGSETPVTAESQRMLGAIVEGPEGLVFFKLIGPADIVGTAAESFENLVASIHAAS